MICYSVAGSGNVMSIKGIVERSREDMAFSKDMFCDAWSSLGTGAKKVLSASAVIIPILAGFAAWLASSVESAVPVFTLGYILPAIVLCLVWQENGRLGDGAFIDPLTGRFNRRGGEVMLRRELGAIFRSLGNDAAGDHRLKVAVAFIDVDHLKRINDTHGHAAGDAVIREVSRLLHEVFPRGTDIVIRQGGDEFIVIVPQMRAGDLKRRIDGKGRHHASRDSLSRLISSSEAIKAIVSDLPVTLSIGIASGYVTRDDRAWHHADGKSGELDQVFNRADKALYIAKDGGRNTIRILRENNQGDMTLS